VTRERQLLALLDEGFRRTAERSGDWLVCKPGCDDCCHGPFPVTELDARRLQRGLRESPRPGAKRTRRRAAEAWGALRDGFPGDFEAGRLDEDEARLDAFFAQHKRLACPALDPGSGRCELYEHRPIACRTYGPPLAFDGRRASHCPLCFDGADPEIVEACRWQPDPDGIEQRLLVEAGSSAYHTLIAFALLQEA
jgi:Fe-S-cluster containining protein